jgi:chaperonin GroES
VLIIVVGLSSTPTARSKHENRSTVTWRVKEMKIRPLNDRVVVKRLEETEEKTSGGIYIPDSAKEKPQKGEIIAVGQGKKTDDGKVIPLDVKVGDKVLFGKYSGSEVPMKIDDAECMIMREDELLGILED